MTEQVEIKVKTRRCRTCGDEGMMPDSRVFTGMETTLTYICPACDAAVEMKSLSQAGLILTVGSIILAVVTFISVQGPLPWDMTDYLLYLGLVILVFYMPANILYPYWCHPVTGEKNISTARAGIADSEFIKNNKDPLQRGIIRFERFGFLGGILIPLLFIVVILGMATVIGMINFYYF